MTYDVGTLTLGETTRRVWSAGRMRHDIAALAGPLHCSTAWCSATSTPSFGATAHEALRRGLRIWNSAGYFGSSQREVLAHMARAAGGAQALDRDHPGAVS